MHIDNRAVPSNARPLSAVEALLAVLGIVLLAAILGVVCSSCVATQEYVDQRDQQLSAKVNERIVAAAQVQQDTVLLRRDPTQLVQNTKTAVELKPLPPPTEEQSQFPWAETITGTLAVAASIFGVNVQRNRARRRRGEPVTEDEAIVDNERWLDDAADRANHYRKNAEPMDPDFQTAAS